MKCPRCNSEETRVTCTEKHEDFTKRYCRCLNCKFRFRTKQEKEKYITTIENPGRKKGSFILNDYQCQMIKKNKYMLSNREWAAIYQVSLSTIITAKTKNLSNNFNNIPIG